MKDEQRAKERKVGRQQEDDESLDDHFNPGTLVRLKVFSKSNVSSRNKEFFFYTNTLTHIRAYIIVSIDKRDKFVFARFR